MKHEKMAPELISLCEQYRIGGRSSIQTHPYLNLTNIEKPAKKPGISVFLRCHWDGEFSALESRGIRVNQKSGDIRTAYLPIEELERLSDDDRIQRIVPARKTNLLMDVSAEKIDVPEFRSAHGLTGRNVLIGVVDSGIDPNHPDFAGRIHSIWDQTVQGDGVAEASFGQEFSSGDLAGSRDEDGHGTHVSGIAAGSDSRFTGVAPEATIVMVKTDLSDAAIGDGVRYIFRIATELGFPAVVNLSLGAHFDAHDGTDELSQLLDQLTGPGRIVCAAAGNEGEDHIHARLNVAANQVTALNFKVPSGVTRCVLNCWYPGSEQIDIAVRDPRGRTTTFQAPILSGNPQRVQRLSGIQVAITTPGPDIVNHDHQITVAISNGDNPIPSGNWSLSFRGTRVATGRVDAWVAAGENVIFTNSVDDGFKIGSPGCASSVITVASFTTRNVLVNLAGDELHFDLPLDDISPFSSGGPLRNGALKPDVAAPGAVIVSARSADATKIQDDDVIADGFMRDQGTSMATPFITGLVALILQSNPALSPVDVKAMLKKSSKVPKGADGIHDIQWGFGRIDAATLMAASAAARP